MNKSQAASHIGCNKDVITRLIKEKKLNISLNGKLNPEEVEAIRKDWEERRKLGQPKWIKVGEVF